MPNQLSLLVLIATPEIEDALVGWLLARGEVSGFSQQYILGHSREHGGYSLVEQVTGRQKRVMFHVQTTLEQAKELIRTLKQELPASGLRYWIIPLIEAGSIG